MKSLIPVSYTHLADYTAETEVDEEHIEYQ